MTCQTTVNERRTATVNAVRFVRKMRGGSQPHLIEAEDGRQYVVKFKQNPQHRRILVNEWIATGLLRRMSILAPATTLIRITPEFLEKNPRVSIARPSGLSAPAAGLHFGSEYPADGNVEDAISSACLRNVQNPSDFVGAFVADLWLANRDNRQAVFCRSQEEARRGAGYSAYMIDNGYCFNGPLWELDAPKLAPLYLDLDVYGQCWYEDVLEDWMERLQRIPREAIWEIAASVPGEWLEDDGDALSRMMDGLIERRARIPELVRDVVTLGLLPPVPSRKRPVQREVRAAGAPCRSFAFAV